MEINRMILSYSLKLNVSDFLCLLKPRLAEVVKGCAKYKVWLNFQKTWPVPSVKHLQPLEIRQSFSKNSFNSHAILKFRFYLTITAILFTWESVNAPFSDDIKKLLKKAPPSPLRRRYVQRWVRPLSKSHVPPGMSTPGLSNLCSIETGISIFLK